MIIDTLNFQNILAKYTVRTTVRTQMPIFYFAYT